MKHAVPSTLLLLLLLAPAHGQTLNNLPVVAVSQVQELSERTRMLGLGGIVAVMTRTEIDRSIVFRAVALETAGGKALEEARAALAPKERATAFLLEGAVAMLGDEIAVDLRVSDVLTGLRADNASVQVPSVQELRGALAGLVERMETELFRGSLGSLAVSSTPPDCAVFLDDRYVGRTGAEGRLGIPRILAGPYALRVEAPGHMEYASELTVQARRTTAVTASLALEPGSLVIDSTPPGAAVTLDSRAMGTTPARIPAVSAGEHKIGLLLEGYVPWEKRLSVESQEEVGLNAKLELLRGSLRVESDPPGASVASAGRDLGTTPLQVYEMEPGPYLLEIALPGYETGAVSARIDRGRESAYSVKLSRQRGFATVHTSPEGSRVVLENGRGTVELGTTPVDKAEVEIGSYAVKMSRDGFFREERRIDVEAGKVTSLEAVLRAVPGSIRVETEPKYAEVLLNGTSRGVSPIEITGLPPGTYKVTVRTAFGSTQRDVAVLPGRAAECTVSVPRPPLLFLPAACLTLLSVLFGLSVFGG